MNKFNVKKVIVGVVMLYGLIAHAADYTPLVVDGAKWVFYESNIDWSDRYMDEFHFCTGEIAGDSIVDGVAYKKYYRYATKTRSATPVALLREADRVVYCRFITPDERYEHSWNRNGEEYIIYNFNDMNGVYKTQSKTPAKSGTVDVAGQPLNVYSNSAGRIIEGLGLDSQSWGDVVTPFIEIPLQGKVTAWGLAKVEKDGSEIYRGACHDKVSLKPIMTYIKAGYQWHYVTTYFGNNQSFQKLYTLVFKGESVVDGHTYVNCYDTDDGIVGEAQQPDAYVRGGRGELYARVNRADWLRDVQYTLPYSSSNPEYLVYDFADINSISDWKYIGDVETVEDIEIEGIDRPRYQLGNGGQVIDGLGVDRLRGNLLVPSSPVWTCTDCPATMGLSHVTDAEGRIIYKGSVYHVKWDVNGDENVDIADVSDLINVMLMDRVDEHFNREARIWGDLNHDRVIDVADLTLLLDIVLGKDN